MSSSKPLPALLKSLREQRGQSLRSTARDLGVDPSYLYRIERGEKNASPELQARVARLYDVPSEDLHLAAGNVPDDIVEILQTNPDILARLREEYGDASPA